MDKLEQANQYINEHKLAKAELPAFHVAPPVGWTNDPNGFSVYRGKIHLFYQYHPYSKEWGPMHWGHQVTEDFIKWEDMPVALAPDKEYDAAGCFSGSGLEMEEGHLLAYTGVMEECRNGRKQVYQNQCLALGNGERYKKWGTNPVITGDMLPENFSRENFRDPKIWREADGYYLLAGNKTNDGTGQVVLFHSDNLTDWRYVSVLAKNAEGRFGTMWECPDFFALDGCHVLIVSPQDMQADTEFHNGNNAVCFLGDYDRSSHTFHYDKALALDNGFDFYAPQTMEMADGRRIMIAWMQSWDSNIRPPEQKWSCMMTLPRELSVVDGKLLQNPVRELENYYTNSVKYENKEISGKCCLPEIKGRMLDLTVEILSGSYREFGIQFAADDRFATSLTYDKEKNVLEVDRTYSGMNRDTISQRKTAVKYPKERLKLRLILDKYSVEIFVNDGEQTFSATFYTPLAADEVRFVCDGTALTNIWKHTIAVD
ncbi:MAG: glycoside hydrolase family 32 protein [Clostridium sp.]|nr:glycoside hydrolase family 32 protein [Clostridium sp.]